MNIQQLKVYLIGWVQQLKMMSENSLFSKKLKICLSAFALAATAVWTIHSVTSSLKLKKKRKELELKSNIQSDTIIVAFQPLDLFIKMRDSQHQSIRQLTKSGKGIINLMLKLFKPSLCGYEENISGKNLRKLLKELEQSQRVRLMIYTRLQRDICDEILDNFGVGSYFQNKNRVYMQDQNKSAEELDCDTGRVVVISALKEDHRDSVMSNSHNLTLDLGEQKLQGDLFDNLRQLLLRIVKSGRGDSIHDDMHQLALELQLPVWNDEY